MGRWVGGLVGRWVGGLVGRWVGGPGVRELVSVRESQLPSLANFKILSNILILVVQ